MPAGATEPHAAAAEAAAPEAAAPDVAAVEAGLRYLDDESAGIRRRRRGRGFSYLDPTGKPLTDEPTLERIRALAIPPAWTDVWICPRPDGHLQATGRDARGRKQYRYHARFRARRDDDKFDRMVRFAERLPRIRRRVTRDLRARGLPRTKVIAAVVRLLELTLLRVGNEEYARLNRSFGLSTLRSRHAQVRGESIRFRFRGKSGRETEVGVSDRRLAAVVRRCQDLPGQALFAYVDADGEQETVDSDAINDYIRTAAGGTEFSAKDFRTWAGTVLAYRALASAGPADGPTAAKHAVVGAVRDAADQLGNTPAVARASYVHPAILDAYEDGGAGRPGRRAREFERPARAPAAGGPPTPAEERAVLALLRRRTKDARRSKASGRRRMVRPGRRRD